MVSIIQEGEYEKINNFYIIKGQMDSIEIHSLICILEFLNKIFSEIFSKDIMQNEICKIYNDPTATCPMLFYTEPISIRLTLESTTFLNQLVYQLSHELCHYAIRANNKNMSGKLKRFEEILCESFSLYILVVTSQRWQECKLSETKPGYDKYLMSYFTSTYANGEGHSINSKMTPEEYINDNSNCESNREGHIAERNHMLSLFREYPDKVTEIIQYTNYIKKDKSLLIDFDLWSLNTINKSFVKALSVVQPQIV